MDDPYWFTPCPPEYEIGPWREACEEVARLCGDPIIPLHYEDLKRLLKKATAVVRRSKPATQPRA